MRNPALGGFSHLRRRMRARAPCRAAREPGGQASCVASAALAGSPVPPMARQVARGELVLAAVAGRPGEIAAVLPPDSHRAILASAVGGVGCARRVRPRDDPEPSAPRSAGRRCRRRSGRCDAGTGARRAGSPRRSCRSARCRARAAPQRLRRRRDPSRRRPTCARPASGAASRDRRASAATTLVRAARGGAPDPLNASASAPRDRERSSDVVTGAWRDVMGTSKVPPLIAPTGLADGLALRAALRRLDGRRFAPGRRERRATSGSPVPGDQAPPGLGLGQVVPAAYTARQTTACRPTRTPAWRVEGAAAARGGRRPSDEPSSSRPVAFGGFPGSSSSCSR